MGIGIGMAFGLEVELITVYNYIITEPMAYIQSCLGMIM